MREGLLRKEKRRLYHHFGGYDGETGTDGS